MQKYFSVEGASVRDLRITRIVTRNMILTFLWQLWRELECERVKLELVMVKWWNTHLQQQHFYHFSSTTPSLTWKEAEKTFKFNLIKSLLTFSTFVRGMKRSIFEIWIRIRAKYHYYQEYWGELKGFSPNEAVELRLFSTRLDFDVHVESSWGHRIFKILHLFKDNKLWL